jgi:hypothetical protein
VTLPRIAMFPTPSSDGFPVPVVVTVVRNGTRAVGSERPCCEECDEEDCCWCFLQANWSEAEQPGEKQGLQDFCDSVGGVFTDFGDTASCEYYERNDPCDEFACPLGEFPGNLCGPGDCRPPDVPCPPP